MSLGDDPMFFFNTIGDTLGSALSGGDPTVAAVFGIALVIGLLFYFKVGRTGITFVGILFVGVGFQLGFIPTMVFWGVFVIVGLVAGFGVLNMNRQGQG